MAILQNTLGSFGGGGSTMFKKKDDKKKPIVTQENFDPATIDVKHNVDPTKTDFTTGLPTVGSTDNLNNSSGAIFGTGLGAVNQGMNNSNSGVGILGGILGQTGSALGKRDNLENQSLAATRGFENTAMNPTLSAGNQQYINTGLADRLAANAQNFGEGGAARDMLGRNLADSVANLDALGVSGTSEASTISNLLGNFQRDKAGADAAAREASRGELTAERNRVSGLGQQFATNNQQAGLQQGSLQNQLLGIGQDIGSSTGTIGNQQASIGADLGKTGISGLDAALGRDIQNRGQEAEIQQGQLAFDMNAWQKFLDNYRQNQQTNFDNKLAGDIAK